MTAIYQFSTTPAPATRKSIKEYQIEVITLDGESVIEYVEAHSEEEAIEIALSNVENADYAMVQGIYA